MKCAYTLSRSTGAIGYPSPRAACNWVFRDKKYGFHAPTTHRNLELCHGHHGEYTHKRDGWVIWYKDILVQYRLRIWEEVCVMHIGHVNGSLSWGVAKRESRKKSQILETQAHISYGKVLKLESQFFGNGVGI